MLIGFMQLASTLSGAFLSKTGIFVAVAAVEGTSSFLPAEIAPLANLGAIGCVLLWFMLRSEPRMQKQTEAIERMTKMIGYAVIALEQSAPAVKKQVQLLVDEVEGEEARRKK